MTMFLKGRRVWELCRARSLQVLFEKRERSLAVDRVRPHEKLDRTAVANAELGVIQEVDLGKLVRDGFVRRNSIEMAALDHERPRRDRAQPSRRS